MTWRIGIKVQGKAEKWGRQCFFPAPEEMLGGGEVLLFVGGRTVDLRHGNVVEPQINAELRAMVDHVVHYEGADADGARQGENWLAAGEEGPRRHERIVVGGCDGLAAVG